ncbi:MAG: phosphoribosylaminoimidazolesuccinocarboxamide synthase [Acidobacteria bacterium]|nr:phosphoribosylaminoimidazolesuccinocarboxamide synthase [Acidobacteriota bacterium]
MEKMLATPVLTRTDFPGLEIFSRGKVRDIYQTDGCLVMIATDRISVFDYVLGSGIPFKGQVLTQLSIFWFDLLKEVVRNHFLSSNPDNYPESFHPFRKQLAGRSMLVQAVQPIPIECVVRGYLSGSGWKEYQGGGTVAGVPLPAGLRESDRLPAPIFTPATKAKTGHDENISFEQMVAQTGSGLAETLREVSLALYSKAARHAEQCGIILADTKFEFGIDEKGVLLIDEVLTPDSSRFWPRESYQPGGPQFSFDKQYVRNYVEAIGWNKQPPAPDLPPEIVEQTTSRYLEIFRRLTGREIDKFSS